MLCIANVHLNDWPMNDRRDVDPTDERIKGLLRAGYIVPLVLPRPRPTTVTEQASIEPEPRPTESAEPAAVAKPKRPRKPAA